MSLCPHGHKRAACFTCTPPLCLDGPNDCQGPVEFRATPDRTDGRAFPRCEHHFNLRLDSAERNLELMSDVPPAWFDPSYAGERWEEE